MYIIMDPTVRVMFENFIIIKTHHQSLLNIPVLYFFEIVYSEKYVKEMNVEPPFLNNLYTVQFLKIIKRG